MKKFVSWMLSLIMIISIIPVTPASAADAVASGDCGENVTWALYDTDDDGTGDKLVISGSGEMDYYNFPWYSYRSQITCVVIENGVTSIDRSAFNDCTSLVEVTIPDSVTTIGDYAFCDCTSLKEITIPDSVTTIGYEAFYHCASLREITIPNSVITMGDRVFGWCTELTSVIISNNAISSSMFCNCTSLKEIIIPGSVTTIGAHAFSNCESLTEVIIPDSVTTIDSDAFYNCTSLKEITIPGSVTTIGAHAFSRCESLTKVIILDGVTSIGNGAFSSCGSLTEITIPDSVTSIGNGAFSSCGSLTEITIPDSVTSIGEGVFDRCDSLELIEVSDENINYCDINGVLYSKDKKTLIVYPTGKSEKQFEIPRGVTSIGNGAFSSCGSLTEITIPDGVTSIGNGAFYNCTSLKEITIPGSVISIASEAFGGCAALTSVIIPDGLTRIEGATFVRCTSLTSVTIPNSVLSIGDVAFMDCNSLETVYYNGPEEQWDAIAKGSDWDCNTGAYTVIYIKYDISIGEVTNGTVTVDKSTATAGETVTVTATPVTGYKLDKILVNGIEIEGNSFTATADGTVTAVFKSDAMASGDCGENVTWALYDTDDDGTGDKLLISGQGEMDSYENYTSVPWNSYRGNIKTVSVGNGVTTIGAYSFYGCTHLKEVTIPNSVNRIKSQAFASCSYLEKITIPGSVKGIGDLAFYWCKSLKEVILEEGLLTIGESAFGECSALEKINIPNSVWYIDDYAFRQCSSLCEIKIPEDVTVINTGTFYNCTKLASITIPSKVTAIRSTAFWWCTSLKTMEFPESLTNIYSDAFNGCNAITDVYYDGTEAGWQKVSISKGNDYVKSAVVHIAKYVITVPQPENGTVSVDRATVARGETVTVTATAADGYELEKILVNDVEITGNTFTPVEDSTVTAVFKYVGGVKIGDTYYETLADAVAAAQSGETIKLLEDTATSGVLALTDSLTLDLNGYTLTSEYIVAFNGNNIIDSSESNSGLLVVAEDKFAIAKNNSQLPVKTESGYKFYEMVKINERLLSKEKYVFQPIIETAIHQELLKGMDATDIRIIVDVTYKTADAAGNEKTGKREFVYSDNFVETFVNSYNAETGKYGKMFSLTISDADKFESLTFTTRVVFADKVEFASPLA